MKVLWLSHSGCDLGAERAMIEGIRGLVSAGHQVTAVLPRGEVAAIWSKIGAPIVQIDSIWWVFGGKRNLLRAAQSAIRNMQAVRQLHRVLVQNPHDVVLTNTLTVPAAAVAARWVKIPHVWYLHEFGERDHGLKFYLGERIAIAIIDRLSRLIIVNSKATRQYFSQRIDRQKLRLVEQSVEVAPSGSDRAESGRSLVIVGGIQAGKRQEDAIRAVAILRRRKFDVKLDIVGATKGQYCRYLRRLVEDEGVGDRVRFVGASDAPQAYFSAANIALMCSLNEAFGRVTVEAMKAGIAVIGARSGATADLIDDGYTGLLYSPGDCEALADRIVLLASNPRLRSELGREAQRRSIARFSQVNYIADLVEVLGEAAGPVAHVPPASS